ncbi:hypothetical protein JTE90_014965 [Oedothorax gibbosus]|uniref:Uncharacterized protein n=1 Tax=Oedothorax gibbosus TaxID=931172 RepID=A0AAV6UYG6_9ARAC|nr:hypothetical protein JTE90_014965 [Oedothorax gibbosus]
MEITKLIKTSRAKMCTGQNLKDRVKYGHPAASHRRGLTSPGTKGLIVDLLEGNLQVADIKVLFLREKKEDPPEVMG